MFDVKNKQKGNHYCKITRKHRDGFVASTIAVFKMIWKREWVKN